MFLFLIFNDLNIIFYMNENLINNVDFTINKCYICFDSCDDKSPCDCDVYVHMDCLIKFAKKNKKNSVICTICKKEIKKLEQTEVTTNMIMRTNYDVTQFSICMALFYFFLLFVYYALGLSTILFITNFIFDYNIILYPDIRRNSFIHIISLAIGYLEYNIFYKLIKNCIDYYKERISRNRLLQIEN